jgi:hypothetical protein
MSSRCERSLRPRAQPTSSRPLPRLSCGGSTSRSLRELAGASPTESYWTLKPLIQDTLGELDIGYPGPTDTDVQVAAARAMCRRLLHGEVTPRELVLWAHQTIGHEGAPRLQLLVELDDLYDEIGYIGETVEELDVATLAEARSIVEGRPMDTSKTYAEVAAARQPTRPRSQATRGEADETLYTSHLGRVMPRWGRAHRPDSLARRCTAHTSRPGRPRRGLPGHASSPRSMHGSRRS